MRKLLIANRGEIALRVVRTAHEMGIATVAVYADQDRDAQYVQMADEAYVLPGETNQRTYLNEGLIVEVARRAGADALHPGYGFLSERPGMARKVRQAGITWVGPDPRVLELLGDKIAACRVAGQAHVPVIPGLSEPVGDTRRLLRFAHDVGYPVLMKREDGGGGRGITLIRDDDGLRAFTMSHDALQGGDLDKYFVEKFVARARHVETQSGRDSHGGFTVYSTRDCSVQRRHQKLIEEAPAPFLPPETVGRLAVYSQRLFEQVGYVGLGTCEFLVAPHGEVYFMEVNPRLQVEHTVSEEVCGLDLVREQLSIADGESLTTAPEPRGHSFELRITSEDPATNLTPSAGRLDLLRWPTGPGVRVDSGVVEGGTISPRDDSMMGKLIVTAQNRQAAVARVRRALGEMRIEGVPTPLSLYGRIFTDPEFTAEGQRFSVTTTWLEDRYLNREPRAVAAGQPASMSASDTAAACDEGRTKTAMRTFPIEVDGRRMRIAVPQRVLETLSGVPTTGAAQAARRAAQPLRGHGAPGEPQAAGRQAADRPGVIVATMQAVVTRINVAEGQHVAKGDLLAVLESMKMENYIYAPAAGTVTRILVSVADGVDPGQTLATLSVDGHAAPERATVRRRQEGRS